MKNYLKTIVTFIFLMAAVAFVPTTSEAALSTPTNLRQTRATDNSVEFTWDTVIGAYDYYTSISDGMAWSEPERAWDIKESYSKLSPQVEHTMLKYMPLIKMEIKVRNLQHLK